MRSFAKIKPSRKFQNLQYKVPSIAVDSKTAEPVVRSLIPPARSHTFVEIDHEIISTFILLPLSQEGLLPITSESMCTKYWLTA